MRILHEIATSALDLASQPPATVGRAGIGDIPHNRSDALRLRYRVSIGGIARRFGAIDIQTPSPDFRGCPRPPSAWWREDATAIAENILDAEGVPGDVCAEIQIHSTPDQVAVTISAADVGFACEFVFDVPPGKVRPFTHVYMFADEIRATLSL